MDIYLILIDPIYNINQTYFIVCCFFMYRLTNNTVDIFMNNNQSHNQLNYIALIILILISHFMNCGQTFH